MYIRLPRLSERCVFPASPETDKGKDKRVMDFNGEGSKTAAVLPG